MGAARGWTNFSIAPSTGAICKKYAEGEQINGSTFPNLRLQRRSTPDEVVFQLEMKEAGSGLSYFSVAPQIKNAYALKWIIQRYAMSNVQIA